MYWLTFLWADIDAKDVDAKVFDLNNDKIENRINKLNNYNPQPQNWEAKDIEGVIQNMLNTWTSSTLTGTESHHIIIANYLAELAKQYKKAIDLSNQKKCSVRTGFGLGLGFTSKDISCDEYMKSKPVQNNYSNLVPPKKDSPPVPARNTKKTSDGISEAKPSDEPSHETSLADHFKGQEEHEKKEEAGQADPNSVHAPMLPQSEEKPQTGIPSTPENTRAKRISDHIEALKKDGLSEEQIMNQPMYLPNTSESSAAKPSDEHSLHETSLADHSKAQEEYEKQKKAGQADPNSVHAPMHPQSEEKPQTGIPSTPENTSSKPILDHIETLRKNGLSDGQIMNQSMYLPNTSESSAAKPSDEHSLHETSLNDHLKAQEEYEKQKKAGQADPNSVHAPMHPQSEEKPQTGIPSTPENITGQKQGETLPPLPLPPRGENTSGTRLLRPVITGPFKPKIANQATLAKPGSTITGTLKVEMDATGNIKYYTTGEIDAAHKSLPGVFIETDDGNQYAMEDYNELFSGVIGSILTVTGKIFLQDVNGCKVTAEISEYGKAVARKKISCP